MRHPRIAAGLCPASAVLICALAGQVGAQPEPWLHPDGTLHYYHAVECPDGITWQAASDSALSPGGHLATLTSGDENGFVFGLVDAPGFWRRRPGTGFSDGPWLGGLQEKLSPEPGGGWVWMTGENPFTPSWSSGQPDDAGGIESVLHFGGPDGLRTQTWDDVNPDSLQPGYVTELSGDRATVGLLRNPGPVSPGYTLLAPVLSRDVYLVDEKGRPVHSWQSNHWPATSAYLAEDGHLLRAADIHNELFMGGGRTGRIEEFDWDGQLVRTFDYSNSRHCAHHDFERLPNGHILLIAWELKTVQEAVQAGRCPELLTEDMLWPDCIVEWDPVSDAIVWEWHVWDHLIQDYDPQRANFGIIEEHPELVDINFTGVPDGPADWLHVNAVDYNPEFDQIVLSVHSLCEVWVIDHSTTTEEARGHSGGRQGMGGDLLYRWGNPRAYRAGTSEDQRLFRQHDANWIAPGRPGAGHILLFNNGRTLPSGRSFSSADEIVPPVDVQGRYTRPQPGMPFGPAEPVWSFRANPPESMFSGIYSSAQRLPNGNTLICEGQRGRFIEAGHDDSVAWVYRNPVAERGVLFRDEEEVPDGSVAAFRVTRYAPDYPGLAGRSLTPGYPIEKYRVPLAGVLEVETAPAPGAVAVVPNPSRGGVTVRLAPGAGDVRVDVFDATGRVVRTLSDGRGVTYWDGSDQSGRPAGPGVYYLRTGGKSAVSVVLTR